MKTILFHIGILLVLQSKIGFSQTIKQPNAPTFSNQFNAANTTFSEQRETIPINDVFVNSNSSHIKVSETKSNFKASYRASTPNTIQNQQTLQLLDLFKEDAIKAVAAKKELWELKLHAFKFANLNSELYKKLQPYYEAAFDSINQMFTGLRTLDLKKAVFLVENAFYQNRLKYSDFCRLIDKNVSIINQIVSKEKLNRNNNVALNFAIQQLYIKPVKYNDKSGVVKIQQPYKYDFEDSNGDVDYSKQFVSRLLYTGKGQCHSMPLLYLILANEIGAKASIAYSPKHSYIVFSDEEDNFYNFECTSGCFPSYSYIMSSGYISKEAVKSGIYTLPVGLKETVANLLNDLAIQQMYQLNGISDFQLKCAKRTLEVYPNDVMALMMISNHQTAKTEAATCYAGWPHPKDVRNISGLKEEFEKRDHLYDYLDNLGYNPMPETNYNQWLNSMKLEQAKQESEEIKKIIQLKAKLQN